MIRTLSLKTGIFMLALALAALLAVSAGGCKSEEARKQEDQIRQVLDDVRRSLIRGDRELFLRRVDGTDLEVAYAGELFRHWQAGYEFLSAFAHRYGDDATKAVQRERKTRIRVPQRDPRWWRDVRVFYKGDSARLAPPSWEPGHTLFWMDRTPQGWRVRAGDFLGLNEHNRTEELLRDRIAAARSSTASLRRHTAMLEDTALAPEQFIEKVAQAQEQAFHRRHEFADPNTAALEESS
jgi:hypothetical protein